MLVDHVNNLSPIVRIGLISERAALRNLLFFSEVNVFVEKLFQCRRNHRIKHVVASPVIDRDVIRSSIEAFQL